MARFSPEIVPKSALIRLDWHSPLFHNGTPSAKVKSRKWKVKSKEHIDPDGVWATVSG
jgi:hypothetical protein